MKLKQLSLNFRAKLTLALITATVIAFSFAPIFISSLSEKYQDINDTTIFREHETILTDSVRNFKEKLQSTVGLWANAETADALANFDANSWQNRLLGFGNTMSSISGTTHIIAFDSELTLVNEYKIDANAQDINEKVLENIKRQSSESLDEELDVFSFYRQGSELKYIFTKPVFDEDEELTHILVFVGTTLKIFSAFEKTLGYQVFIEFDDQQKYGLIPEYVKPSSILDHGLIFEIIDETEGEVNSLFFELKNIPIKKDVFGMSLALYVAKDITLETKTMNLFFNQLLGIFVLGIVLIILGGVWLSKRLAKPISDSMFQIKNVMAHLELETEAISKSASSLSEAAKRIDMVIQTTSSATTEIRSSMEGTRLNSERSRDTIHDTEKVVSDGKGSINASLDSVQKISSANENFKKITDLIRNIEKETKFIDSIVFKTQLLSVNASIEASRAGDFGRGFSVVAEEISNLAKTSGESADRIHQSIESGVEEIDSLLKVSETTAQEGKKSTAQSAQSFEKIQERLDDMVAGFMEILDQTSEQNIGLDQISKSVQHLENHSRSGIEEASGLEVSANNLGKAYDSLKGSMDNLDNFLNGKKSA